MMTALTVWAVIGTAIAVTARHFIKSTWTRAISGGLSWPTWPALIAISRIRFGLKRKAVTP